MASPKLEKTLSTQLNLNAKKSRDCVIFLGYGICSYYPRCKFNHPSIPPKDLRIVDEKDQKSGRSNTPCKYYLAGTCKYRSFCKFDHSRPRDLQVQYNSSGLPLRQGEPPCYYYLLNGVCGFGAGCKYDHPKRPEARSSGVADDGAGLKFDLPELHDARSSGVNDDGAGFKFDYPELHDARSSGVTDDGAGFKFNYPELHAARSSGVTNDAAGFKTDHPELHDAGSSGVTDDGAYGSEKHIKSGKQYTFGEDVVSLPIPSSPVLLILVVYFLFVVTKWKKAGLNIKLRNMGKGVSANYEKNVVCKFGRVNFAG